MNTWHACGRGLVRVLRGVSVEHERHAGRSVLLGIEHLLHQPKHRHEVGVVHVTCKQIDFSKTFVESIFVMTEENFLPFD